MHKKLLSLALSLVMLAGLAQTAMAEYVYVTKYGKKYHKEDSRFIQNRETEKITREEAEERGYEPSSDFSKDAEADNETDDSEK